MGSSIVAKTRKMFIRDVKCDGGILEAMPAIATNIHEQLGDSFAEAERIKTYVIRKYPDDLLLESELNAHADNILALGLLTFHTRNALSNELSEQCKESTGG